MEDGDELHLVGHAVELALDPGLLLHPAEDALEVRQAGVVAVEGQRDAELDLDFLAPGGHVPLQRSGPLPAARLAISMSSKVWFSGMAGRLRSELEVGEGVLQHPLGRLPEGRPGADGVDRGPHPGEEPGRAAGRRARTGRALLRRPGKRPRRRRRGARPRRRRGRAWTPLHWSSRSPFRRPYGPHRCSGVARLSAPRSRPLEECCSPESCRIRRIQPAPSHAGGAVQTGKRCLASSRIFLNSGCGACQCLYAVVYNPRLWHDSDGPPEGPSPGAPPRRRTSSC